MSVKRAVALVAICIALVLCQPVGRSQSDTAAVTGRVLDPSKATISNATITVLNVDTQAIAKTITNENGLFTVTGLPPGNYRIEAAKVGFKTVIKPDVVLHLQDVVAINFSMILGSMSESVTVEGGASMLNMTDGSISTIVDRKFVENMPLNGRSFQDLILLTPGVVTNTPQIFSGIGLTGEFSVNGQRTESNNYSVDGASANTGISPGSFLSPSNSGSLPASTALGTTQGLVSVDALQEFRVETSTYSAEYGRNPGGQFSFVTRSGTNEWHGTAFHYLRNDVFDANDWFNNYNQLPKSALRQNDFGGVLGGPVRVPLIYDGRDKTFFFFSYEGLRLVQPQAASVSYVPDTALRQSTPVPLQAVMNAFPVANGPDLGNGLAEFIDSWSNPSALDSYSLRFDHAINERLKFFFHFSDTPSKAVARSGGSFFSPSSPLATTFTTRAFTLGSTALVSSHFNNEFRLNYSSNQSSFLGSLDNFGGATPVDLAQLQGISPGANAPYQMDVELNFPGFTPQDIYQTRVLAEQRQWNAVDTVSLPMGRHQWRIGVDYRRIAPIQRSSNPSVTYIFDTSDSVQTNSVDAAIARSSAAAYPLYTNVSMFGQDQWRVNPRLSVSLGLRWDINPAPGAVKGNRPYTVQGTSLSTLQLAPQGTPLWDTSWHSFAPRLGVAYVMRNVAGQETVVRGGFGVFFDTGQQLGSQGYNGPGFFSIVSYVPPDNPVRFPMSVEQAEPPIVNPPVPPYGTVYAFPAHLQAPFTLQWNATIDQAFGKAQKLTISYVGANGRKLLEQTRVLVGNYNPDFGAVFFFKNGHTSDYDALQVQFQRQLSHGLQALASYTWAHSIDYGSQNTDYPYIRGNSSLDIRHNFSTAFSYDLPGHFQYRFARALFGGWGLDDRFTARTGFPVTLNGRFSFDPATGQQMPAGLNLIPNQPLYVYGPNYPGGRAINVEAFQFAAPSTVGNAPRNFVRGFGAWQMDVALRREFSIHDRLKLQFRAESFNVFNHPNFGQVNPFLCPPGPFCTFGQAQQTLAQSLGVLSPLYQMGGPRSMQFAIKLMF